MTHLPALLLAFAALMAFTSGRYFHALMTNRTEGNMLASLAALYIAVLAVLLFAIAVV
jgi:hypothetical protein